MKRKLKKRRKELDLQLVHVANRNRPVRVYRPDMNRPKIILIGGAK